MFKLYSKIAVNLFLLVCVIQLVFGNNLTTAIIKKVLENSNHNLIFSPVLLTEGLWQLFLGAEGETAEEISKVLQLNGETKNQSIEDYMNFRNSLIPLEHVTWFRANSLFLANDINILPQYVQQSNEMFQNEPQSVDFANSSAASWAINDWVTVHTNDKITNLIDRTNGEMKALFLSAIYFKGLWKYPFESENTLQEDFHIPLGTGGTRTVKVDMMVRRGRHRLNEIDKLDARSLELPYTNINMSMVFILPNSVDGIDRLLANLDKVDINDIAPKSYEMSVLIHIPKFKIDVSLELKDALKSLGISELFQEANFSAMTDFEGPLRIDDINQRAVIEVDEEGSTLHATRDVRFSYFNFPMVEIPFRVDHPFVFLIKDDDIVYFAGLVTMK